MKIILLSMFIYLGALYSDNPVKINNYAAKEVILSKVKVVIDHAEVPLSGVEVSVYQSEKRIGRSYTDDSGITTIICKYLPDNNKVKIIAEKEGYQRFSINGSLITSLTTFSFSLKKIDTGINKQVNLDFQFEDAEIFIKD